jgi:putative ABC transport system permease protein
MKYLPLVWRNLLRRKFRTTFTIGCIFISFVLYAFLMVVRAAFTMGVDFAGADRLWLIHKVSIIQFVPVSYLGDILRTPGVSMATHCTWFGGSYQNKPSQFATFATDLDTYLKLYPEFKVPTEQLAAALADRQGAIVGRDTVKNAAGRSATGFPSTATSGCRSPARPGSSTSTASMTATRTSTRRSSYSDTTTSTRIGGPPRAT